MFPDTSTGGITGATTYHWTQIGNILRDPFEIAVATLDKSGLAYGGALAGPSTAYLYNWNILPDSAGYRRTSDLPIGQLLWTKELESYAAFPPLQDPASYNLESVLQRVKQQGHRNPSE